MANTISFWKLLCNESEFDQVDRFVVPVIQRDYAQGRTDDKATTVRKKILQSIGNALNQDESVITLNMDFIYGARSGQQVELIDGQQRFTTLFLLHWFIAGMADVGDAFNVLKKFTYRSRPSSMEFCDNLCENYKIIFGLVKEETSTFIKDKKRWKKDHDNKGVFTVIVQDSSWFLKEWEQDPTVCSMLNMLDAILESFYKGEESLWYQETWDKLTGNNPPIVFHFLPVDQFGNSEDLYIKMNSRGKALTDFENFKAVFGKHLEKPGFNELYREYWENIDGEWSAVFWDFIKKRYEDNQISQEKFYFSIDDTILKYIWLQVEMYTVVINADKEQPDFYVDNRVLFRFEHIDNPSSASEDWTEKSFKGKNPEELIISSLRNSKRILELIEELFDGQDPIRCWKNGSSVINQLFVLEKWNDDNTKIEAMFGTDDYFIRILAFVVIYWCSAFNVPETEAEKARLKGYLRAVRNCLQRHRSKKSGRRYWDPELDKKNYGKAVRYILGEVLNDKKDYIEQLSDLSQDGGAYFNPELEKCCIIKKYKEEDIKECEELEDSYLLQGSALPLLDKDKPMIRSGELKAIFDDSDKVLLGKALLACGDDNEYFAIPSGESGNNRKRIAFCDREPMAWSVALIYKTPRDDFSKTNVKVLRTLLGKYRAGNTLEMISEAFCSDCETKNNYPWRYYFIRYGEKLFKGETGFTLADHSIPKYPTLGLDDNDDFFASVTSYVMSRFKEDNTCNVFLLMAASQIEAEIVAGQTFVISRNGVQVEAFYSLDRKAFIIRCQQNEYQIDPESDKDVIKAIITTIEELIR